MNHEQQQQQQDHHRRRIRVGSAFRKGDYAASIIPSSASFVSGSGEGGRGWSPDDGH